MIPLEVVTVISGYGGTGKTALICNVIADRTCRGEHVVIWHSGEDSQAKWERRIELMAGVMALVHFVETQAEVWAVLNATDPPAMLVIDPLQQFLDSGAKNDEAVQTNMNELTRLTQKNCMAIVAIMHWKEHYRDKLVGSEATWQIARMVHKVEKGQGPHGWILRRVRSQDAPLNEFLRFHTYKTDPNEPVLAKFDTTTWERDTQGKGAEAERIEAFILETTGGHIYSVRGMKWEVQDHGEWNYRRDIAPWFRSHGWQIVRGAFGAHHCLVPPNYRWHKERGWQHKDEDGLWSDFNARHIRTVEEAALVEGQKAKGQRTSKKQEKIEKALAAMPAEVGKVVRRELRNAENDIFGGGSNRWLDLLIELPWAAPETPPIDIAAAERILNEDHYGLAEIKERILAYLTVRKRVPEGRAPILCFVGGPGVGKTSIAQSIAKAMGRKFVRVALGGVSGEYNIRGHGRTFRDAQPGKIIEGISRAGVRDCVMLLDEIDKLGASTHHGDPKAALLEVLDPEQNSTFKDNYLDVPFDLSRVVFLTTANVRGDIPGPLRDRMEVIELKGYTADAKFEIARRHLIGRQLTANGVKTEEIEITDAALHAIIRDYAPEPGVRELERKIGNALMKIVMRIEKGQATAPVRIECSDLEAILGPASASATPTATAILL
jgi:ATPase family associated with various cellular activities (AAA)/AAA domain